MNKAVVVFVAMASLPITVTVNHFLTSTEKERFGRFRMADVRRSVRLSFAEICMLMVARGGEWTTNSMLAVTESIVLILLLHLHYKLKCNCSTIYYLIIILRIFLQWSPQKHDRHIFQTTYMILAVPRFVSVTVVEESVFLYLFFFSLLTSHHHSPLTYFVDHQRY